MDRNSLLAVLRLPDISQYNPCIARESPRPNASAGARPGNFAQAFLRNDAWSRRCENPGAMPHPNHSARCLRFGVFEADLAARELTKQGKLLPLQEQPFQLLAMLLEKPGALVTREELRARLWPQTVVDFDHGLNKAISKIRDTLGDSAENPRFIQTVARRGYRFLAEVREVGAEPAAHPSGFPDAVRPAGAGSAPANPRPRHIGLWILSALAL